MPNSLWSSMNQNAISLSFEDGFTPVKACADLTDYVNICGDTSKESEKFAEHSSQVKRRRLHFNSEFSEPSPGNVEISPAHPRPEETEDSAVGGSSDMSQKVSGYSDASSPGYEIVDQPSDAWIASYLNDNEMHYNTTNLASGVQIDKAEFCKTQSTLKVVNMNQDRTVRTHPNVFRGRKSYIIQTPPKLASSIVYPFTFIKPCGILGDMTLKDINQRIRTPPPKLKGNSDDDSSSYPTSAFSGKPVVGRTTLSTDGGKGSITIMRTKG